MESGNLIPVDQDKLVKYKAAFKKARKPVNYGLSLERQWVDKILAVLTLYCDGYNRTYKDEVSRVIEPYLFDADRYASNQSILMTAKFLLLKLFYQIEKSITTNIKKPIETYGEFYAALQAIMENTLYRSRFFDSCLKNNNVAPDVRQFVDFISDHLPTIRDTKIWGEIYEKAPFKTKEDIETAELMINYILEHSPERLQRLIPCFYMLDEKFLPDLFDKCIQTKNLRQLSGFLPLILSGEEYDYILDKFFELSKKDMELIFESNDFIINEEVFIALVLKSKKENITLLTDLAVRKNLSPANMIVFKNDTIFYAMIYAIYNKNQQRLIDDLDVCTNIEFIKYLIKQLNFCYNQKLRNETNLPYDYVALSRVINKYKNIIDDKGIYALQMYSNYERIFAAAIDDGKQNCDLLIKLLKKINFTSTYFINKNLPNLSILQAVLYYLTNAVSSNFNHFHLELFIKSCKAQFMPDILYLMILKDSKRNDITYYIKPLQVALESCKDPLIKELTSGWLEEIMEKYNFYSKFMVFFGGMANDKQSNIYNAFPLDIKKLIAQTFFSASIKAAPLQSITSVKSISHTLKMMSG